MKKQITRISAHQTSKVIAIIYFVITTPFVAVIAIATSLAPVPLGPDGQPAGPGPGVIMVMPFLYLILGYIMTVIGCFVYNLVAKFFGGIEFEVFETGSQPLESQPQAS